VVAKRKLREITERAEKEKIEKDKMEELKE